MSISITKLNKIIGEPNNLMIVFSDSNKKIITKKIDNYVFIYSESELIGINIFDYKNEFDNIKFGYHKFSNNNFNKIVKKYPKYVTISKNKNFIKIGLIKEINKHPKNYKLTILSVETNNGNIQVITNLNNLILGNKYLFAIKGAFLATGIIIDELNIMGIKSQGIICSYKSIGINKDGIIEIINKKLKEEYEF